jgi:predicted nuclease of restriction endonuclease-like RecB superfamily
MSKAKKAEVQNGQPEAEQKPISKRMEQYYAREAKISAMIEFITNEPANEQNADIKKIAESLVTRAAPSGERAPRKQKVDSVFKKVCDLFKQSNTQTEDSLWNALKVGREEMRKIRKDALNKVAPADRLWISFNVESGVYILEGQGETAPEGWKGFMPKAPAAQTEQPA